MTKKIERVFLVDDDETYNFYNQVILTQHNPEIEIKSLLNGEELIQYINESDESEWPAVLFLDLNMNLVDGPEFLEWYHKNGHQGKMKIVMFSASILQQDVEDCTRYSDVLGYFEKPIDEVKLNKILEVI